MEVGQAATYVNLAGKTQDCLIAKIREDGKANIVVISADGGLDDFGRLRSELDGIPVGENKLGCVCELDSYEPAKKKKPAKKKAAKKKATKKKAS